MIMFLGTFGIDGIILQEANGMNKWDMLIDDFLKHQPDWEDSPLIWERKHVRNDRDTWKWVLKVTIEDLYAKKRM